MKPNTILLIAMLLPLSGAVNAQTNESAAIPMQQLLLGRPGGEFIQVSPATLPATLSFAGERVPMENYDTRESLLREMSVTMYMQSRTMLTLLNTTRYLPIIEPILERNGIPDDFKYLCMAESGLNPNIVSVAGAAGLWQIMSPLARSCGMEVGPQVDERYHIEKATQVACKYLKDAYRRFGSWTLAAASYNVGMAGLATRMEKQKVKDYYDLFLPEETMRYLFRVLSMKLVTENPARYGFAIAAQDYYKPLERWREVEIGGQKIDWSAEAAKHGTTYKMLREVNAWIRDYTYDNKAGRTYKVKVPRKDFRD